MPLPLISNTVFRAVTISIRRDNSSTRRTRPLFRYYRSHRRHPHIVYLSALAHPHLLLRPSRTRELCEAIRAFGRQSAFKGPIPNSTVIIIPILRRHIYITHSHWLLIIRTTPRSGSDTATPRSGKWMGG